MSPQKVIVHPASHVTGLFLQVFNKKANNESFFLKRSVHKYIVNVLYSVCQELSDVINVDHFISSLNPHTSTVQVGVIITST